MLELDTEPCTAFSAADKKINQAFVEQDAKHENFQKRLLFALKLIKDASTGGARTLKAPKLRKERLQRREVEGGDGRCGLQAAGAHA